MKRLCCLAAAMMLAGCTASAPAPDSTEQASALPVLEVMVMGGGNPSSVSRISRAISERTAEELHCTVSLKMVNLSEYDAELNRLQMNGELPDLFVCPSKKTLCQLAEEGQVLCLDDLLEEVPELCAQITDPWEWRNVEVGEQYYAVPFNNNRPFRLAFAMRADLCAELGIDASAITDLDTLETVLLQVHQAYPELDCVVPNYAVLSSSFDWDTLSNEVGGCSVGVLPYREPMSTTLELITDVPEFQAWCERMYRWNQEGLIMPETCFNQEPRQTLLNSGQAFGSFLRYFDATVYNLQINQGTELTYAILSDSRTDTTDNGSSFCVRTDAENPALCLEFLQMLYTDPELLSLCAFGQEGIDYTVTADGSLRAIPSDQELYAITLWCWPNNRSLLPGGGDTGTEPTLVSPAAGFFFDTSACQGEAAACDAVMDIYYPALMSGTLDPAQAIPQMRQALLDAGAEKVLAEQQRQLDAWIAQG